MIWSAEAPANIALIKYMGKSADNVPLNPSLSFTLDKFNSKVELEETEAPFDEWDASQTIEDSDRNRFLKHLSFLKESFGLRENFRVRSTNNFPSHCGLASSASSFAALTKCAAVAASHLKNESFADLANMNRLSRRGSGSSCRSFFSPFAIWDADGAWPLNLGSLHLLHQVVVVDSSRKEVSSSDAHKRVLTSGHWDGRPKRAHERLQKLIRALEHNSWREAYEITWAEFQDMHELFQTSRPSFGYMKESSLHVLEIIREFWESSGDGPLVTMDAGPNVHLLYREDQKSLCGLFRDEHLKQFKILGEGER
jgi:diphosphomevalonate decarboxylase